jgi:hypothetical protein
MNLQWAISASFSGSQGMPGAPFLASFARSGQGAADFYGEGLLERYIHFGITAGRCVSYYERDPVQVQPHNPPRRVSKHNNGYFSARQVLLVSDSFIRGEQEVKTRLL